MRENEFVSQVQFKVAVSEALEKLGIDSRHFDLIIEEPSPTDWVRWQIGSLTPRLQWKVKEDLLWKNFGLSEETNYIAVQPEGDVAYPARRRKVTVGQKEGAGPPAEKNRPISSPGGYFPENKIGPFRPKLLL